MILYSSPPPSNLFQQGVVCYIESRSSWKNKCCWPGTNCCLRRTDVLQSVSQAAATQPCMAHVGRTYKPGKARDSGTVTFSTCILVNICFCCHSRLYYRNCKCKLTYLTLSLTARVGKKLPIMERVIAKWSFHIKLFYKKYVILTCYLGIILF